MLNEIFKGMDNAAEQINENFEQGSVVDSGKNENGYYVKFGDGTMICRHEQDAGGATTVSGSLFRTNTATWNFPHEFAGVPYVDHSVNNPNRWGNARPLSNGTAEFWQYQGNSNGISIDGYLFAIGRWK